MTNFLTKLIMQQLFLFQQQLAILRLLILIRNLEQPKKYLQASLELDFFMAIVVSILYKPNKSIFMKNLILLFIAVFFFSCSKSDSVTKSYFEQNPLQGYLSISRFEERKDAYLGSYPTRESGFSFIPNVNGKINAIIAALPYDYPDLRVTVWDKASSTVLRTEIINVTTPGTNIVKQIEPINLQKDKEYVLSYNVKNWYRHEKQLSGDATYPIVVNDIKITGFYYSVTTAQLIPSTIVNKYYDGDCTFNFLQTE